METTGRFEAPTIGEVAAAQRIFAGVEPRGLFYRAATELVEFALSKKSSLSVAEALAVLLQTWNVSFYRFHGTFDERHFAAIEHVLAAHEEKILSFRQRTIETFGDQDRAFIEVLFQDFEAVLGAVGAAKALHLLAPRFFPLWDRAIAGAYGLSLRRMGTNAPRYRAFMAVSKWQVEQLGGEPRLGRNPIKALDEYNYCKHTKFLTVEGAVEEEGKD